jgi:hypothetical protein
MAPDQLKLAAFDEEDLAVLSATLQDAVTKVEDLVYLPREKRFALAVNRFVWEKAATGASDAYERRRAVLRVERVAAVKTRGIDRTKPDTVLSLLAVRFLPGVAPGGEIELAFAGAKDVRLAVECVEVAAADLGAAWATASKPEHPAEGA